MAPTFFDLAIATIVFEPRDLIRLPVPPNYSLHDLLPQMKEFTEITWNFQIKNKTFFK